jgi:hypothetical protein
LKDRIDFVISPVVLRWSASAHVNQGRARIVGIEGIWISKDIGIAAVYQRIAKENKTNIIASPRIYPCLDGHAVPSGNNHNNTLFSRLFYVDKVVWPPISGDGGDVVVGTSNYSHDEFASA